MLIVTLTVGLDPPTLTTLSPLLHGMAAARSPRLLLTLRPQDPIPDWITHLIYLGQDVSIKYKGEKEDALQLLKDSDHVHFFPGGGRPVSGKGILLSTKSDEQTSSPSSEGSPKTSDESKSLGEVLVEMSGVQVKYGTREVLGAWKNENEETGLYWKVRRGQRWGVFGPNGTFNQSFLLRFETKQVQGSGKTTLISLICSDHPQTYSLPVKLFGRTRLPQPGQPGISIFDIQARIGQSSPEIHAFFPKSMNVRQVVENAYADTFLGKAKLDVDRSRRIDGCLSWFQGELNPSHSTSDSLNWAQATRFGEIPFSSQRVVLFLRAVIKNPDLVILDEAFSGMDETIRDKCMSFLESPTEYPSVDPITKERVITKIGGLIDHQALVCVSHIEEEVPKQVRDWICLPEPNEGKPARFGRFNGSMTSSDWQNIWKSSSNPC
jgi:ABC-type molybdenum transport system ATPase subunit/photorepair protein PhrA